MKQQDAADSPELFGHFKRTHPNGLFLLCVRVNGHIQTRVFGIVFRGVLSSRHERLNYANPCGVLPQLAVPFSKSNRGNEKPESGLSLSGHHSRYALPSILARPFGCCTKWSGRYASRRAPRKLVFAIACERAKNTTFGSMVNAKTARFGNTRASVSNTRTAGVRIQRKGTSFESNRNF